MYNHAVILRVCRPVGCFRFLTYAIMIDMCINLREIVLNLMQRVCLLSYFGGH